MRVVLDTNVLVSAALKDRSLPALAVHIIEQRGVLLKSTETEQQIFDVLAKPHFIPLIAATSHAWLKRLFAAAKAGRFVTAHGQSRQNPLVKPKVSRAWHWAMPIRKNILQHCLSILAGGSSCDPRE
jgi:predicted nucleic acid-binding protein